MSRILRSTTAWEGKYIKVEEVEYLYRDGTLAKNPYEVVRRNTHGRIVVVLALTKALEVVVIRTYRVPHDRHLFELPAGLADKQNELPDDLAARELIEETGYATNTPMVPLIAGPFDSGANDDELVYFLALDAERVAEQSLEPEEDIEVELVPLKEIERFCYAQQPNCDLKILAPICMARHLKLIP